MNGPINIKIYRFWDVVRLYEETTTTTCGWYVDWLFCK